MTEPPLLISQHGTLSVPASDRLEEAVLWSYSFTVYSDAGLAFEVEYNGERTSSYTMALENADGVAQVRVTASDGAVPLVLIAETTLVPVQDAYRYRTSDGAFLAFEEAAGMRARTVVIERLNVLHVQSARARVREISFSEPTLPFVQNVQRMEVGGTRASIVEHLTNLLHALLGDSPFASQPTSIECRYGYAIGGLPIEAPVVLVARQDLAIGFDDELIAQIEEAIRQWLEAVQPPAQEARLIFAVTCWSAIPQIDAPLLRLTNLSLPMADILL